MSAESEKYADIEETLFGLIRSSNMDNGSLLVLLSLVNMMGIINIINYRAGIKKAGGAGESAVSPDAQGKEVAPEGHSPQKGMPFDPAALLSMMGGKEGTGLSPGNLEGLLKRFMRPAPGREGNPGGAEPQGGDAAQGAGKGESPG